MRTNEEHLVERSVPRVPKRLWRSGRHGVEHASDDHATNDLDGALEVFSQVRPRLFGIAYRMMGSVADAEDLVQEVWLRWQRYDRGEVREPAAFLATTTTRLAINELQSARARREEYVGPWLPEPVDTGVDPELAAEAGETIEIAVLFLLERLSPAERAAYVLHEAFGYPYRQIAEVIKSSEEAARQLASRARKHLTAERHESVSLAEQRRFLTAFLDAARSGDIATLTSLLTEDVVSHSDGGGVVNAARIPIVGRDRVVKFVMAVSTWFWEDVEIRWIEANGRAAAVFVTNGEPFAMSTASATVDGLDHLFWMMNPAKLGAVFFAEA